MLVLPTLILLFALVMFVREGYSRAGVSAADTRTHGWVNVMTSCTSDSVPSPTALREEGGWSISRIGTLAVVLIRLMGIVDDQPLLLLTENARTIGSFEIGERRFSQSLTMDRPDALGGEARYGHQIVLMCDEDTEKLEMPGFGFSLWSFVMWNEFAWQRADL
ncbi:MAG: hypothetical protein OEY14_02500 [Myxococcales bacterium]|nr:hypothetical protein [Myxococcales bacterium]